MTRPLSRVHRPGCRCAVAGPASEDDSAQASPPLGVACGCKIFGVHGEVLEPPRPPRGELKLSTDSDPAGQVLLAAGRPRPVLLSAG